MIVDRDRIHCVCQHHFIFNWKISAIEFVAKSQMITLGNMSITVYPENDPF